MSESRSKAEKLAQAKEKLKRSVSAYPTSSSNNNLDALTNAELKELLAQHGLGNNQPVTHSTRSVLISSLRKRMQETSSGSSKARSRGSTAATSQSAYLARYSSADEESDRESNSRTRTTTSSSSAALTGRGGGAATSHAQQSNMPPPATKRKRATQQATSYSFFTPSNSSSVSYGSNNLPSIKVPIQPRSSVYIPPPTMHSSDTEESDSNAGSSARNPYLSYGRLSGLSFPKRYSPAPQDSHSPSATIRNYSHSNASPTQSRLSDSHSGGSSAGEDSPYVSDFTKRLLQFRQEPVERRATVAPASAPPPNTRYFYRMPSSKYSMVHQAAAPAESGHPHRSISSNPVAWLRGWFCRLDEHYGVKQNFVPFVLVGAVVLFVAFLVFMYLTISPDLVSTITLANCRYQRCNEDGAMIGDVPGENCIFENDLEAALDFLRLITPELQARVERHMCKDPGLPFTLTANEAMKMRVDSMQHHDEYDTQRQLVNMEYLVEMNPQWHVSNLNGEGAPLKVAELRERRHHHHHQGPVNAFGILKPRLPLTCLFLRKLQTFFVVVGTLGLGTAGGYLINWLYKYRVRQKEEKQKRLNSLILQILQVVMDQAAGFPNNPDAAAVVVNHLRDKLIEPAQRTQQMEGVWQRAISFLEHNESRVQFEVGTRNGEECKLVRWVDTIQSSSPASVSPGHNRSQQQPQLAMNQSPAASGSSMANGGPSKPPSVAAPNLYNAAQLSKVGNTMMTAKKWQSPAFDKSNKITAPPTPCLKIRQMFDKYEAANPNLRTIIADAILEKVGPTCKVYDILLEPQACCVYVRCATAKDAGMVHDEINGWWFDNRLVSIKFLRLERFMDRFPESANSRHLLRPSNPQKLSLTQCNRYDEEEEEEDLEGAMEDGED